MNTAVVGLLVAAAVLGPSAFLVFDNAQGQMDDLNNQFSGVMNETTGFLDNAWDVAQEFQNPDYNYDPSQLGNSTVAGSLSGADR